MNEAEIIEESSTEIAVEATPANQIIVPFIGTIVNTENPDEIAQAISEVNEIMGTFSIAKRDLSNAMNEQGLRLGRRTLVAGSFDVSLSSDTEIEYDDEAIRVGLRAIGCPEERIDELVVPTVTYKVNGSVRRQMETNPEYKAVIESAKTVKPKQVYATVKPRG